MADKESDIRIGKFTIFRRLGRGGMGAVYEGYDPALDRRVAIKTLTTEAISDKESRNRFEREAKAAAKLSHPNIVTIYELGNFGGEGKPYIVMEYLEGTDVTSLIGRQGLPLAEALDITIQLCRALDFAHQNGVVHRDVKPSNLRYLDNGQVKIMDFGIARLEGSDQITRSGVMIGTLHYMSPEQIRGQKLDGRTDIFAAGCILYELLTGKRPFPGDSATSILYNIVHETPKPILEMNAELPQEIGDVLNRALAKNPDERFAHAGDMAVELEKILGVYRKTLPRATGATQKRLDELAVLTREQRWQELVDKARELVDRQPQLEEARRYLRRGLRAVDAHKLEERLTAEDKTKHRREIHHEITELYGEAARTERGSPTERETRATEVPNQPPTKAVAETVPATKAAPEEKSAVWTLAAPIWALVIVIMLGVAGSLVWLYLRDPPGPAPVEHTLTVFSDPPGAEVFLNGAPTGLSTSENGAKLRLSGVENDLFSVEVRLERYADAGMDVRLYQTPPDPLEFVLTPTVRIFNLETNPPGASVRLDGEELDGVTPLTVELPPTGDHELRLSKPEYQTRTVELAEGEDFPEGPIALRPLGRPGTLRVESPYPVAVRRGDRELAASAMGPSVTLRPGRYNLRLVAPNVFLDRAYEVQIEEGQTAVIRAPALGRVFVRANPGNCTVTISGFSAGSPPFMNREIAVGTHEFEFVWGEDRDRQSVRVEEGKPTYVIGQRP